MGGGRIHCIVAMMMSQRMGGPVTVKVSTEWGNKPLDLVDGEHETGSGGISTDLTRGPSMGPPRLIPVPQSPQLSAQLLPEPAVGKKEPASSSFDRNCASSQDPVADIANYDRLSYSQLREICRQRGYHKQDTEAALRPRLVAMDAASKKTADGGSNDMDTSTTVLG